MIVLIDVETTNHDSFRDIPSKEKRREEILDESLKKFEESRKKKKNKSFTFTTKKKSFLKIGLVILIIAIICFAIISYLPWMYISYRNSSESDGIEKFYYKDFKQNIIDDGGEIANFLDSKDSILYLGLDVNDLGTIPNSLISLCYVLIVLSMFFIAVTIFDKKINFSHEKIFTFQTIGTSIVIVVLLYFIYILVEFLGINILLFTNTDVLKNIFPEFTIIFPAPLALIFIVALLTKICFTVIKSNYNEMIKLSHVKKSNL